MDTWMICKTCEANYCTLCEHTEKPYTQYKDKRKDVDIYLDVDGVLFAVNDGIFELRNGFIGFLRFLVCNFKNCYWLTSWYDGFNKVLQEVYAGTIAKEFKTAKWNNNKAEAIDFNRDFAWIEDGISKEEMQTLKDNNVTEKYIPVNPEGQMDALYEIKEGLRKRFNIL
jgi:hypothetical protein